MALKLRKTWKMFDFATYELKIHNVGSILWMKFLHTKHRISKTLLRRFLGIRSVVALAIMHIFEGSWDLKKKSESKIKATLQYNSASFHYFLNFSIQKCIYGLYLYITRPIFCTSGQKALNYSLKDGCV